VRPGDGIPQPGITYIPKVNPTDPITPPNITYPPITTNPQVCEIAKVDTCIPLQYGIADRFGLNRLDKCTVDNTRNYCWYTWTYNKATGKNIGILSCDQSGFDNNEVTSMILFHESVHNTNWKYARCTEELRASIMESFYYGSCKVPHTNYKFYDPSGVKRESDQALKFVMGGGVTEQELFEWVKTNDPTAVNRVIKNNPSYFGSVKCIFDVGTKCDGVDGSNEGTKCN
jgi:hypothetical protein